MVEAMFLAAREEANACEVVWAQRARAKCVSGPSAVRATEPKMQDVNYEKKGIRYLAVVVTHDTALK